jgi:hypothetical protein
MDAPMTRRVRTSTATATSFDGETLVVCPRCEGCATSRRSGAVKGMAAPRTLACPACGHSARWSAGGVVSRTSRSARDEYFGLPLWLRAPCDGHTLWAYNREHLEFIAAFVAAGLRERTRDPQRGWSNRSLASRLPRWIKLARHRDEVLRAVAKLRRRLD